MATKPSDLRMPPGLTKVEKAEFKRIKEQLQVVGYQAIDEAILRVYLHAYAVWHEAKDLVAREGLVIPAANGVLMPHPGNTIVRQQSELLKKLCQELLLSPGARKRAKVELGADGEDDSDLY